MKWTLLLLGLALITSSNADDVGVESYSKCWTAYARIERICFTDFGPDYVPMHSSICGYLGGGKRVRCKKKYEGCKLTGCHRPNAVDPCQHYFNGSLPVHVDYMDYCLVTRTPLWHHSRCCPNRK